MNDLFAIFSYDFIRNAFIAGTLVSLCASLLGVSLVLKRYSMIGDGLSHVGFGALAVAAVMGLSPLKITIPIVVIAAIALLRISESGKIKGDAAISLISTGALAFGIIIVSVGGVNTDLNSYLFGSILAISKSDMTLSVILSIIVIILFGVLYNIIFSVTFDERFSKTLGINTGLYNMLIAVLTAVTIVLGMRMLGSLLISALIVLPSLTAMRVFKSFKRVTVFSAVISVFCFFSGMLVSYALNTPAGATVVAANIAMFIVFSLVGLIVKKRSA